MDGATPGDPLSPDARMIAQLMLDSAREDHALLARSRGSRNGKFFRQDLQVVRGEKQPPLVLESKSDLAAQRHLEDLISVAVASAQQADEAVQRACHAGAMTRRSIWALAGISILGALLGVIGFAEGRLNAGDDGKLALIAKDIQSLSEQQSRTDARITTVRSELTTSHETAIPTAQAPSPGTVNVTPREVVPNSTEPPSQTGLTTSMTTSLHPVTYASLWPSYPQPARQTWNRPAARRVVVPPFFTALQQNVRAIFR